MSGINYDDPVLKITPQIRKVLERPFEEYPEWLRTALFTSYVLEPSVKYDQVITDPFEEAIENLGSNDPTLESYFQHRRLYNQYMQNLADYYGSPEAAEAAIKGGWCKFKIPNPPSIKEEEGGKKLIRAIKNGAPETRISYSVDLKSIHKAMGHLDVEIPENESRVIAFSDDTSMTKSTVKELSADARVASLKTMLYRNSGYTRWHSYSEESDISSNSNLLEAFEYKTVGKSGDLLMNEDRRSEAESTVELLREHLVSDHIDPIEAAEIDARSRKYLQGVGIEGYEDNLRSYYKALREGGIPVINVVNASKPKGLSPDERRVLVSIVGEDPMPEGLSEEEQRAFQMKKILELEKQRKKSDTLNSILYHGVGDSYDDGSLSDMMESGAFRAKSFDMTFDRDAEIEDYIKHKFSVDIDEDD